MLHGTICEDGLIPHELETQESSGRSERMRRISGDTEALFMSMPMNHLSLGIDMFHMSAMTNFATMSPISVIALKGKHLNL